MSAEIDSQDKKMTREEIESKGDGNIYKLVFYTPNTHYPDGPTTFVRQVLNKNCSSNDTESVVIAARELIANAIEHGNRMDSHKLIMLVCGWIGRDFYFVIQDEGLGFDITNAGNWTDPEGGYGIPVVKRRVDLLYNFNDSAAYFVKSF